VPRFRTLSEATRFLATSFVAVRQTLDRHACVRDNSVDTGVFVEALSMSQNAPKPLLSSESLRLGALD